MVETSCSPLILPPFSGGSSNVERRCDVVLVNATVTDANLSLVFRGSPRMQFGKTYAPQRNSIEAQILNYRRCPAIRFRQCQPELQGVNWSRSLHVFVVDDSRSGR